MKLALLFLAATVQAAHLTISSPQLTITAFNSTVVRTESLNLAQKPSSIALSSTETLKLTFQVVKKEDGKGIQPHQTFLRFYDAESGEEGIQPVPVKKGGKAKFELNTVRPPSSLPPTNSTPLDVSLLLGSFTHSPARIELFELYLPQSQPPPAHPDEASFHPLPPIAHTFRPEQKHPPKIISLLFVGIILAPWLVLLGLWNDLRLKTPFINSPKILAFITLLSAFEVLLISSWIALKLGQVLLYGGVLGVFTILAGKQALAQIGKRRVGQKQP